MRTNNLSTISRFKSGKKHLNQKSIWTIIYILWIILLILSQVPFIAENYFDIDNLEDSYEYHLSFTSDGKSGHYYVERNDPTEKGQIDVIYTTKSNSLDIECTNIKVLRIYCREVYEEKSQEIFKMDPKLDSNYYKTYFIDNDKFHVHVSTENIITELTFIDTPTPYNVTVNGQEWWLTGINYTYNDDGIILTKVPAGQSFVNIYFKSNDLNSPSARFTVSKTLIGVGETDIFNASASNDFDGQIENYFWDLGDGTYKIGVTIKHSYSAGGNYKVILTVRDNDHLIDRAYQDIKVVQSVMSLSKSVDKPIGTPGSILTYTLKPTLNASWQQGVKDIVVADTLPKELDYIDGTPLPQSVNNTLIWKINTAFDNNQLPTITFKTIINENVENGSIISNQATLDYKGIIDQQFLQENSNLVSTKVNIGSLLAPKIKETVPNVELHEDDPPYQLNLYPYEYDLSDYGTDLKWYITNENDSLYILSGEYSDDDIIIITPLKDAYGKDQVTLWLVDSEGYSTNQPLWINIEPVNDKPIFSSSPDLIIHYNNPYTFNYESYIYDVDTPKDDLILFAIEKQKQLDGSDEKEDTKETSSDTIADNHIQIDDLKVTYNFPKKYMDKQVFISLIVFDGKDSDGDTIQINITNDYTPKLTSELPDLVLEEGETKLNIFDLDDYFEDPDGDSLFFSFGETQVSVVIHDNHSIDISAPPNWNGIDTVTFRAKDPIGAIAEDTIFITVMPINDPPIIAGVPDTFIVHYDADYSFDLSPYITDEDNELEDLFLILNDVYIHTDPLNQLKIVINYPKKMVGLDIPVILIVSDGFDTGSQTVTVKITSYWPPEIRKYMPDVSFYEDQQVINAFTLNNFFSDKDSDTLYYSYGQKYLNITIHSNSSVDFTAEKNWYGVETVTFRATDFTNAFVETVITVTVIPVNDPPIIKPVPLLKVMAKEFLKFDLSHFIDDIDNDITDLVINVTSDKLEVFITGRELVIYSDSAIIEQITLTVTDGQQETSETILVEVQEDKSEPNKSDDFIMSILWLLILLIIIIISLTGYASLRRYIGNYEIEEVYWIMDDGILVTHINYQNKKHNADEDIVSGMLTAILDFSEDAFSEVGQSKKGCKIKEIKMENKNILVERGKYTFLATVFSGRSGQRLYSNSGQVMKMVESRYGKILYSWSGDINLLIGSKFIIKSILKPANSGHRNRKRN